jgi:hypothetical protein
MVGRRELGVSYFTAVRHLAQGAQATKRRRVPPNRVGLFQGGFDESSKGSKTVDRT